MQTLQSPPAAQWRTSRTLLRPLVPLLVLAAYLLLALSGCGVQTAGSVLAFLRDGQLWTVRGDDSGARMLASGGIVGFAWSPDHHSLVFRTAKSGSVSSETGTAADAAGTLQAISINGGFPLQISPDNAGLALSDAWWDADGNRVLYREATLYVISQTDQPVGLARKLVVNNVAIPALAPDGQRVAVIDAAGNVQLGKPGADGATIASGALLAMPGTSRPVHLLWQPRHDAVAYPAVAPGSGVTLVLKENRKAPRPLATVSALLDAAFAPDGSQLLVRTPTEFELWDLVSAKASVFSWPEADPTALPWWSPDGKTLLVQDSAGWQRINVAEKRVDTLLSVPQPDQPADATKLHFWHPATGSPWSPDGGSIVFAGQPGATWRGAALPASHGGGPGLYVVSLGPTAVGTPALVDSGDDASPAWGYADPSTVFLVGAA